ncbi:MAG TPA: DegT/DnrJ/EryC1/StrS family aminotransferase [Acidisarcina sp.]|nr:DegT/DnrJ/EryC1/StrS family aminotransferase [Acidisarcina sp.]
MPRAFRHPRENLDGASIENVLPPKESSGHSSTPVTPSSANPVPVLDFSRQYAEIGPEMLAAVERVFATQHYILGEQVAEFERQAAATCNAAFGIGCASGTDALWLAMAAAGIGEGDAVITTPFTFFATVSSILRAGAEPVLADIDPVSFNLNPGHVETILIAARHPRLRAVMPVHLYGQTAEWDRFEDLRRRFGLLLIEDAAQAFGAAWDGRPAGSLGDLAAFSFYPTKNLSACGDAGMVTTSDENFAQRAKMLRAHGMRRRYYHDEIGWNSRLDTIQAAILLVKLAYVERWNERRRQLAANYDRLFHAAGVVDTGRVYPEHGVVLPACHPRATHVYHQYVLRVRERDTLRKFLSDKKIGSEIYYPVPLHQQECLKFLGYKAGDLPESERAAAEVLALPMYPELREEEQQTVVSAIAAFLG